MGTHALAEPVAERDRTCIAYTVSRYPPDKRRFLTGSSTLVTSVLTREGVEAICQVMTDAVRRDLLIDRLRENASPLL